MPAFLKKRDNILVLVFGVVLAFFIGRMLQMQLIQGDEYESQIYKGTIKTQTVEAARGEMTDRYGNPIVTNRVSMNLVLDKAYLPAETQNEIILQLMGLLEQSGEQSIPDTVVFQLYIIGVDAGLYELDVVHTDNAFHGPGNLRHFSGAALNLQFQHQTGVVCLFQAFNGIVCLDLTVVDDDDAVTDGTDLAQNV